LLLLSDDHVNLVAFVPDVGYFSTASKRLSKGVQRYISDVESSRADTSPSPKLDEETSPFRLYQSHQLHPKVGYTPTLLKNLPGGLLRTPSQVNHTQHLRGSNPRCFLPFRSLTMSNAHNNTSRKEDNGTINKHYLPLQPNFLLGSPERTQLVRQKTIDDIAESQRKQRISRILSLGIQRRSTLSAGLSKINKPTSRHGSGPIKHVSNPLKNSMIRGNVHAVSIRPTSSFRQVREAWA